MTNLSGTNLNNGAAVGPQGEGRESPSNFPKYPAYKDSGVEWLGEVPDHWVKSSIKHVAAINMGQSPNSDDCNTDGVGLPFLQGNGEFGTKYPTPKQYCPVARKIADAGDLLFSVRAPVGALNEADQIYGIGRGLCAMKASREISKEFFWWFLSSSQSFLDSISTGSTFEAVSAEQVANIAIALPRLVEQTQIARFLDHETARIDALIEEQQRLIELLKEKRQAVISHAVTKGLDPTVPMKDSGVEWLGEVPAHWSLPKLGHLARVLNGSTPSRDNADYWLEGNVPWVASGALNDYRIESVAEFITQKALCECSVEIIPRGAVLVGLVGQGRTRGLAALLNIQATINQNVCAVVPNVAKVLSGFLHLYLHSIYEALRDFGRGANQAALNCELVSAVRIPLPSLEEQQNIVQCVENKLGKFDALENSAQRSIELMHERRSALISAAVTGKIDVRGWQPPASTQASENNTQMTV